MDIELLCVNVFRFHLLADCNMARFKDLKVDKEAEIERYK